MTVPKEELTRFRALLDQLQKADVLLWLRTWGKDLLDMADRSVRPETIEALANWADGGKNDPTEEDLSGDRWQAFIRSVVIDISYVTDKARKVKAWAAWERGDLCRAEIVDALAFFPDEPVLPVPPDIVAEVLELRRAIAEGRAITLKDTCSSPTKVSKEKRLLRKTNPT